MYIASAAPRSTTLVSPATISTPAASAAVAIASTSAFNVCASRPSSRISETVSANGRAPAMARSLAVPLTASSPIEPPGKRSGLTTKLSVVIAIVVLSSAIVAASASFVSEPSSSRANAGTNSPSISVRVALPPAPWARVTC